MLFLGNILLLFSGCVFVSSSAEMPKSNFKVFITQFFFLLPSNNVRCVYPLHSIVYRSSERKIYVIDKFSIEKHNEKKENHNLTRKRDVSVTFQTCSSSPSLALFFAFIRFIWRHECGNGKNVSTYILFVWQSKNHKKWWDWDTHRAWQLFRRKEKNNKTKKWICHEKCTLSSVCHTIAHKFSVNRHFRRAISMSQGG